MPPWFPCPESHSRGASGSTYGGRSSSSTRRDSRSGSPCWGRDRGSAGGGQRRHTHALEESSKKKGTRNETRKGEKGKKTGARVAERVSRETERERERESARRNKRSTKRQREMHQEALARDNVLQQVHQDGLPGCCERHTDVFPQVNTAREKKQGSNRLRSHLGCCCEGVLPDASA